MYKTAGLPPLTFEDREVCYEFHKKGALSGYNFLPYRWADYRLPFLFTFRSKTLQAVITMPIISRFLGIIITMYWDDHSPPHFHAKYGEYEITVDIRTGVIEGKFPKRALRHVLEWHEMHSDELLENWRRCGEREALNPIEPLE